MSDEYPHPAFDVGDAETVTFRYEVGEDEPPSHAFVAVASAIVGSSPTDLEPLGRHVDLEALDELVASVGEETALSASIALDADGLSFRVDDAEIVGVASRDLVDWSQDGT